jgi:hypothetical protein
MSGAEGLDSTPASPGNWQHDSRRTVASNLRIRDQGTCRSRRRLGAWAALSYITMLGSLAVLAAGASADSAPFR